MILGKASAYCDIDALCALSENRAGYLIVYGYNMCCPTPDHGRNTRKEMRQAKLISPVTKQEVQRLRVAAYCRVSSNSADQKHSYAQQVKYYIAVSQQITKNS